MIEWGVQAPVVGLERRSLSFSAGLNGGMAGLSHLPVTQYKVGDVHGWE